MNSVNSKYIGRVVDVCDSIVSVSGLNNAAVGELFKFKDLQGDITGFV